MNQIENFDSSKDSIEAVDISFENIDLNDPDNNIYLNRLTEEKYKDKLEIIRKMKMNLQRKDYPCNKEYIKIYLR